MKIKKEISLQWFLPLSDAEIQVSFIQLKPVLDSFLCGFGLSSCPQNSLKVILLPNPMRLHRQNISVGIRMGCMCMKQYTTVRGQQPHPCLPHRLVVLYMLSPRLAPVTSHEKQVFLRVQFGKYCMGGGSCSKSTFHVKPVRGLQPGNYSPVDDFYTKL